MEQQIGNYTILRELARGGMGVVFVARQQGLEREVALKLHLGATPGGEQDTPQEARARERFDREAHAVARLRHPHVIQVHEFGLHRGVPYLVMDLIQGESLEERLARDGALEPGEALRLLTPVAEAVAYAHGQGILHRDIKPANILIDREGRPYLTDFGLARDLSDERDRLTRSGQLLGTPYYMAPEAAAGSTSAIDARTDVYALGAVLFQALTGEPAFVGDSLIELLRSIVSDPATPPSQVQPGVPPELDAVVLQCLEKEPQHRYADAGELAADLARFTQGEPVSASRSSLSRGLRRISKSRAWLAIPLLVALAVLGLVLDRAWLAPARAAERALQAELAWQREVLRPTLYGLDPRRPLELNPGDLRKRLDELEQLPPSVDADQRLEARGYLAAYVWLLERSKGRKRNAALEVVPGRPDVAVRAVVAAREGDFAAARRLLGAALPDAPELRATELGLQARYEPIRFLSSGPQAGGSGELELALLPLALEEHFRLLLSDGLSSGQEAYRERLAAGAKALAAWGEAGQAAAKKGLSAALSRSSQRYERLAELDVALALERLDRLRGCWRSVGGCPVPQSLLEALHSSQRESLRVALGERAGSSDAERAYGVGDAIALLSGELRETDLYRKLIHVTVAKQGTWPTAPRLVIGVVHHDYENPKRSLNWLESMLSSHPGLARELEKLYPEDPITRSLTLFDSRRALAPELGEVLAGSLSGLSPHLCWVMREKATSRIYRAAIQEEWTRADAVAALELLLGAMTKSGAPDPVWEWQRFEVEWRLADLRGQAESARAEFEGHIGTMRAGFERGTIKSRDLAAALIRLAAVSDRERGEPLLEEALRVSPTSEDLARPIRASWR